MLNNPRKFEKLCINIGMDARLRSVVSRADLYLIPLRNYTSLSSCQIFTHLCHRCLRSARSSSSYSSYHSCGTSTNDCLGCRGCCRLLACGGDETDGCTCSVSNTIFVTSIGCSTGASAWRCPRRRRLGRRCEGCWSSGCWHWWGCRLREHPNGSYSKAILVTYVVTAFSMSPAPSISLYTCTIIYPSV